MPGPSSRAKTQPKKGGVDLNSIVYDLYMKQNLGRLEVTQKLKEDYGFDITERRFKNIITKSRWRKNANKQDYLFLEMMISLKESKDPEFLSWVCKSNGIPLTEGKIKRNLKEMDKRAPATTEDGLPPPSGRTGGPSALSVQAGNDVADHWSPFTGDETSPEPEADKGPSSIRLEELLGQLQQREEEHVKLELQMQALNAQIKSMYGQVAGIRQLVPLETTNPRLDKKGAPNLQPSYNREEYTTPQQGTQQQPYLQPSSVPLRASNQAEMINDCDLFQSAATVTAAPLDPAHMDLAMADSMNQWNSILDMHPQSYHLPSSFFEGDFAQFLGDSKAEDTD